MKPLGTPSTSSALHVSVGVVGGSSGAVGKEIIGVLENRNFPVTELKIFGSSRSAGRVVPTKFGDVTCEEFSHDSAAKCDVVFLAVSGEFALEHAEKISKNAVVIDNSSAFRMKSNVPLVIPAINGDKCKGSRLIANPNCTTAIGLMAVSPLHKLFGMKKMLMSTYQASSGAGQEGMDELHDGTAAIINGGKAENKVFAHQLPFNLIPHIDKFQENGYTKEEMKVTWETRKILGLKEDFPVSCTAVRIPIYRAHSETIVMETEKKVDVAQARAALEAAVGVKLVDDTANNQYPMPLTATNQYDIEVGRIRRSEAFGDHGLEFFVAGDQLLRGAALNAVEIAEKLVELGDI
jgi:aspartate-semialdehyde dehydrogenase